MNQTTIAGERAPREIPVRRLSFDFGRVRSAHWFGGDPFQSHLLHALSLTFPDGERFFMDSVRYYLDRLESPALRHEVSRFLAQEAAHGQAHEAFNQWVRSLGLDADPIVEKVRADLAAARDAPHRTQLAATCALEHLTAILAELLFSNEEIRAAMEPELRRLWMWHALEETEHKAVAFDTYQAVGGTYPLRALVMLLTTADFLFDIARFQIRLLKSDPSQAGNPVARTMVEGWVRLWVYPGLFRPLIPAYLDYFRPGFHPWQRKPKGDFEAIRAEFSTPEPKGTA
jgi:predicted metal-dependent hydrolase